MFPPSDKVQQFRSFRNPFWNCRTRRSVGQWRLSPLVVHNYYTNNITYSCYKCTYHEEYQWKMLLVTHWRKIIIVNRNVELFEIALTVFRYNKTQRVTDLIFANSNPFQPLRPSNIPFSISPQPPISWDSTDVSTCKKCNNAHRTDDLFIN